MIKNDEHFLDCLDRCLQLFNGHIDFSGQLRPGILNVLNLIDVERARVRSKLVPHILVHLHTSLVLEKFHGILKGVRVRRG